MSARTQDEILARFRAIADDDWMGFRREVVTDAMTLETLCAAYPDHDPAKIAKAWEPTDTEDHARQYLTLAIGKILDHRGISATRSVSKLGEYAWLLGRDDVVEAMHAADYAQYGAPKVKAFAEGMGWPWPGDLDDEDAAALARMAEGKHCEPEGCGAGCGL